MRVHDLDFPALEDARVEVARVPAHVYVLAVWLRDDVLRLESGHGASARGTRGDDLTWIRFDRVALHQPACRGDLEKSAIKNWKDTSKRKHVQTRVETYY